MASKYRPYRIIKLIFLTDRSSLLSTAVGAFPQLPSRGQQAHLHSESRQMRQKSEINKKKPDNYPYLHNNKNTMGHFQRYNLTLAA